MAQIKHPIEPERTIREHIVSVVKEDIMGMAQGYTDSLKSNSLNNVRCDSFNDLGSPAMGFVERADPARSDRGALPKTLDELGKTAAMQRKQ